MSVRTMLSALFVFVMLTMVVGIGYAVLQHSPEPAVLSVLAGGFALALIVSASHDLDQ